MERLRGRNRRDAAKRRKALSGIKDALFDSCPLNNVGPGTTLRLICSNIWSF